MGTRLTFWTWVLGITGFVAGNSVSANLEVRTSVGYDFVSQEYFLDSVTTDTTLSVWLLKSNYLDDFKGKVSLTYLPKSNRVLELGSSYEQSSELYRLRFNSNWRPKFGDTKLEISNEFERRGRQSGASEFGDAYLFGYSRAALSTPISDVTTFRVQMSAEVVRFDSTSGYNYNYYRVGPKIGISRVFEGFSFLDANLFLATRQVPDSSLLDYVSFGVEGSFLSIGDAGDVDLYTRLERKDYDRPGSSDDHFRIDFDGRGKAGISDWFFTKVELQSEIVIFGRNDPVNFDFGRTGWALLGGVEKNGWTLAAGPAFELLMEQEGSLEASEDYFEMGGKVEVELLKAGRFLGSIESELGYRNLSVEEEFHTNFVYNRLNTIGNFTLRPGLNLNWLFSAEWEWHEIKQDNSEIFLLSTNLSFSL